ncbi:hypothetical protein FRACYDRAFT_241432 [Fragilariopsis cylindrus CCMP1102]|uniref:Uncharacterized protein n=1 Tax=Fragilariopsis cylindrus CCMP1102 TaxID=635003 RepID=A0A1E7F9Q1_9STRA|nr:hypothetical protein FRACYDRAFT_241432 [Fragilariopsis cylindrus CCMP1102]|eukprot:OEU14876.1 hypothetical protein FRACYDRAFT_241432 [Fragilariopsis cylindrus CCMP1102]
MSSRFSGGSGSGSGSGGGGGGTSSSSSSMVVLVEDSMVEENFATGCNLVEPIVERMLSDRVSVGMIQQETKSKIKAAIEKRILFPNNNNINNESTNTNTNTNTDTSSSRSKRYTMSPVLKYMQERCSSDNGGGTIYVAYVPKGMGKTTACYAFATATANENSRRTKNNTKVLALLASSPTTTDGGGTSTGATFPTCLESMVSLFNLRWGALPLGFVTTLIQSLIISEKNKKNTIMGRIIGRRKNDKHKNKNRSYLILDEFMSNGINTSDEKLVLHIKKLIQNTNVCVFLLTSNKESANYLLTLNDNDNDIDIINNNNNDGGGGGGGIQPLVESSVLASIRRQRSQQQQQQQQQQMVSTTNNNNNNSIPSFDWDLYCCMEWTDEQIQDAILGYDEFMEADTETKRLLKDEIKEILAYKMTDQERKKSNPLDVKRKLLYSNHPTQAYSYTKSTSSMSMSSSSFRNNKNNILRTTSSIRSLGSSIATAVVQSKRSSSDKKIIIQDSQKTEDMVMINDSYIEMV